MSSARRSRIGPRVALPLMTLLLVSCGESRSSGHDAPASQPSPVKVTEAPSDSVESELGESGAGDSLDGVPIRVASFDYCDRAGSPPFDQLMVMKSIATTYDTLRWNDCRTAGLTPPLEQSQVLRWQAYLINYSMAMAGCPLTLGPAEGGTGTFGPANIRAIGLPNPALSRDEARLLLDKYLETFAHSLHLLPDERAEIEAFLWGTAQTMVDTAATGILSRCEHDGGT